MGNSEVPGQQFQATNIMTQSFNYDTASKVFRSYYNYEQEKKYIKPSLHLYELRMLYYEKGGWIPKILNIVGSGPLEEEGIAAQRKQI